MPELPEVETIRRDLVKKIINKKIVKVEVYKPSSVAHKKAEFIAALEGNAITKIERRGKLMIFWLKRSTVIPTDRRANGVPPPRGGVPPWRERNLVKDTKRDPSTALRSARDDKEAATALLCHLKMTGQLIYEKETKSRIEIIAGGHKLSEKDIDALPNKWTRIAFVFADGGELFFNDLRLFGYMKLATQADVDKALKKYGPEPLETSLPVLSSAEARKNRRHLSFAKERAGRGLAGQSFTFFYFSSLFKKRANTNIKALLLNQELIAGLGNIYVDEVCFAAGVKPTRRVGSVTKDEQKKLFSCIPKILTEALKHRGTTFRNFLDSSGKKGNYTDFLKVYDRDGQPCKKCSTIIQKTKVAGRGTHYCAKCQH